MTKILLCAESVLKTNRDWDVWRCEPLGDLSFKRWTLEYIFLRRDLQAFWACLWTDNTSNDSQWPSSIHFLIKNFKNTAFDVYFIFCLFWYCVSIERSEEEKDVLLNLLYYNCKETMLLTLSIRVSKENGIYTLSICPVLWSSKI